MSSSFLRSSFVIPLSQRIDWRRRRWNCAHICLILSHFSTDCCSILPYYLFIFPLAYSSSFSCNAFSIHFFLSISPFQLEYTYIATNICIELIHIATACINASTWFSTSHKVFSCIFLYFFVFVVFFHFNQSIFFKATNLFLSIVVCAFTSLGRLKIICHATHVVVFVFDKLNRLSDHGRIISSISFHSYNTIVYIEENKG